MVKPVLVLPYCLHAANTITESTLAANQEVFGLLTRWLADLAPLSDRARVGALARQLIKVEAEIEGQYRLGLDGAWRAAEAEAARRATETEASNLGDRLAPHGGGALRPGGGERPRRTEGRARAGVSHWAKPCSRRRDGPCG